ncbi:methyltransferase domain-containing protein [Deinococcus kurensis]|uniref:methyltransferase domain-containing protein n=1 Tax=Deinococcus kurensis TaxID=2662757 RepID=UPI001F3A8B91|nr:methyltransferase domain-containing protein [Deinococcus kurensis]
MTGNLTAGRRTRVMIGAGEQQWDGWTPTQQADLDLLDPGTFAAHFGAARADAFLCEHVWEHLSVPQSEAAARLVFAYLTPGGRLRVAVPDGHHPDPAYQALVAVGGPGPAHDHQVVYTLETFVPVFTQAGFDVRPLEWWDAAGQFHQQAWRVEDGPVYRSRALDHRNAAWRAGTGGPGFTSLILDCVRPDA